MARILVLYYSSYGHTETMAHAISAGACQAGGQVVVKRVPDLVPPAIAAKAGYIVNQPVPTASVAELPSYDAIIFGTPTRYGMMAAQMKNFLDQTSQLWAQNRLVGKLGAVFTSTGLQHGGHEATILSFHTVLLHLGMIVVGLPYSYGGLTHMEALVGCSPYGASTLSGKRGERTPTEIDLEGAKFQGRHLASLAAKLAG